MSFVFDGNLSAITFGCTLHAGSVVRYGVKPYLQTISSPEVNPGCDLIVAAYYFLPLAILFALV